jgi:hypothetical protein
MSTLEREILNFMSSEARFDLSRFKSFISKRFDAEKDEVDEAIRVLEKDGEIYRPESGRITRLEA